MLSNIESPRLVLLSVLLNAQWDILNVGVLSSLLGHGPVGLKELMVC